MNDTKMMQGDWRIFETELWELENLDLVAPAMLSLRPKGAGHLALIAIEAELDYRAVTRDGLPGIEFSFHGFDEGDEVVGRGWAIQHGEQLEGRLFFHQGDDSSFIARRQTNEEPPANNSLKPTHARARAKRSRAA